MPIMRLLLLLSLSALLSACVNQTIKSTSIPPVQTPSTAVDESLLLDVNIAVFAPGLDIEVDEKDVQVYPEVRRAEARYMPGILAEAMQDSGAWGAIRVVPDNKQLNDLLVEGKILYSDGEQLQLAITATDARGEVWLKKKYTGHTTRYAYDATKRGEIDPFQALYNTIANDLLEELEKLELEDRRRVRLVTELRFARGFSPAAFADYLEEDEDGEFSIIRLPAEEDPMLARVREIRQRDRVFIDTLQEYYANFEGDMSGPYQEWRKLSYEEVMAMRALRRESTYQLIAGAAAVIGGILAAADGDHRATRNAGNVAIFGGGALLKSGLQKRQEAQIHVDALEELGASLEAEITPQVIDLQDRTVTLSGNVEEQYAQWRTLLAEIYQTEIGALELPEEALDAADTL